MGFDEIMTKERKKLMLMVIGVLAVLWYFCLIIVPIFPNGACPAGLGVPGSFGGSSGGGTNGGTCPVCDCSDPTRSLPECPPGYIYDTGLNVCTPPPTLPYCSAGTKCPVGGYDTGMNLCRCPTDTVWDSGLQLCCPTSIVG